jgi:hypothetical protein
MREVQNWRTQGKKCFTECSGSVLDFFRDSWISETKGINFFSCVQDLFDEALSPQYGASLLGSDKIKGNVLRGGVVLNLILSEINM